MMVVLFYIGVVVAISVKGWNRVNNTSIETIYRTQSCEQQFPLTLRRLRYSTFHSKGYTTSDAQFEQHRITIAVKASNSIPSGHVCGFKNGSASPIRPRRPILHSSLEVKVADKEYKARLCLSEASSIMWGCYFH